MVHGPSPAFKAFVDASAGAMGALFATVLLYPLDVVKTQKQIAVKQKQTIQELETTTKVSPKTIQSNKAKENMFILVWIIYKRQGFRGIFAGLSSKVIFTICSQFAFFYWYSFLKSLALKRGKITTSMNLFLASLAGALNMSMTLPLEMINTRAQIQGTNSSMKEKNSKELIKIKSTLEICQEIYEENGILSFWKGFLPSLVLVSNPSINFTIFDKLKLQLQTYHMGKNGKKNLKNLSWIEAFILAAIAKAIATIITYPIIRAKVLMQAEKKKNNTLDEKKTSMLLVLQHIGQQEGLHGYYKGCSAQLFNTVLKSAILVMTKEQITIFTMKVLYSLTGVEKIPLASAK